MGLAFPNNTEDEFSYQSSTSVAPPTGECFEIVREGDCMVVEPMTDLGELDHWRLESELDRVLEVLSWTDTVRLVFDMGGNNWGGGAAVALFVALARRPELTQRSVTIRGLSDEQRQTLKASGLDGLWPSRSACCRWDSDASGSYLTASYSSR